MDPTSTHGALSSLRLGLARSICMLRLVRLEHSTRRLLVATLVATSAAILLVTSAAILLATSVPILLATSVAIVLATSVAILVANLLASR